MKVIKAGCGVPASNNKLEPILEQEEKVLLKNSLKEEQKMIKVGKPAPLFSAKAYFDGKFVNISLDDYKGQWVYLCFYPGDFTFV